MCGRYYVDDETAREIEKLVETVNDKLRLERLRKDIHPTDEAPVLVAGDGEMKLEWQHWGFPNFQGKGVIFNARSETVLEKKMFRESILHRRIIIPCTWFYEWKWNAETDPGAAGDETGIRSAGTEISIAIYGRKKHILYKESEAEGDAGETDGQISAPVCNRGPSI